MNMSACTVSTWQWLNYEIFIFRVNKHSVVTSVNSTASVADHWDTVNDVKPFIQKPLNPYNTFDGLQNCLELNTNIPSEGSVSSSQPNSHVSDAPTKPRKYGRYQNPRYVNNNFYKNNVVAVMRVTWPKAVEEVEEGGRWRVICLQMREE